MKNKKFVIICCVLIVITTISLIITSILKEKPDKKIQYDDIENKMFSHTFNDESGKSTESIVFKDYVGTKTIKIVSDSDNDDVTEEIKFSYVIKDNNLLILYGNLTYTYRMKNNCLYDTENPEIKYCIEKDA